MSNTNAKYGYKNDSSKLHCGMTQETRSNMADSASLQTDEVGMDGYDSLPMLSSGVIFDGNVLEKLQAEDEGKIWPLEQISKGTHVMLTC